MSNRLTTREAAKALGCSPEKALALLHAAATPHERIGPFRGPILWDATAVDRLCRTLGEPCQAGAATENRKRPSSEICAQRNDKN